MKKRLINAAITAVLVLALAFGCTMAGTAKSNGQQELNIIEDNYRNYYEIFVGSFYDSDGDGMGDLNGIVEKLDYIEDMGFNGIWLMPVMPSPTYHKYDVTDYKNIDTAYGTVDDFKNLVEACHEKNIRLIIDMVLNHTSSQHPWFMEACEYLKSLPEGEEPNASECPYVDYYHFSREQVNSTYYRVPGTDWWYEGSFWSEMPDLNLANELLRKDIQEVADFWQDLSVDGFRMDAAMHFEENDIQGNNEVLNWLYTYCKEKDEDFYMVSEVWASEQTIADYYGSGTPSMFNFAAGSGEGKLVSAVRHGNMASLLEEMVRYQEDFSKKNPDYIDAPFLTNHDMVRVANALISDPVKLKMAAGLLLTMNGSPFVYYGEEIGMKSAGTKDENKRIPMLWSNGDITGLTDGPADMDPGIESSLPPVDKQLEDEGSLLNYYKQALRLRNSNPELARGEITVLEELCDGGQAVLTKTYGESTIGVLYNISEGEATVSLSGTVLSGCSLCGGLTVDENEVVLDGDTVTLPAHSIAIVK